MCFCVRSRQALRIDRSRFQRASKDEVEVGGFQGENFLVPLYFTIFKLLQGGRFERFVRIYLKITFGYRGNGIFYTFAYIISITNRRMDE